jgi:hypothetical protein
MKKLIVILITLVICVVNLIVLPPHYLLMETSFLPYVILIGMLMIPGVLAFQWLDGGKSATDYHWTFGLSVLALAAVFFLKHLLDNLKDLELKNNGVEVNAVVLKIEDDERRKPDGSKRTIIYHQQEVTLKYSFNNANFKETADLDRSYIEVGDTISILISPNNPRLIKEDSRD